MNIKLIITFVGLTAGLFSCTTCRYAEQSKERTVAFEINKTPCFGKCPVYNMFIFTDGTVLFEGINFVENEGLHTNKLTKKEYSDLCKSFSKAKWKNLENEYIGDLPDLPRTTIIKYDKKSSKSVLAQFNIPSEFTLVEKEFVEIAKKSSGWSPISRGPNINQDWRSNEFIIKLNDPTNVAMLESKYSNYELKMIKKIAPDLNYWVFGFNNQKFASSLVYYLLKNEANIDEIQFNRSLEMR